MNLSLTKKLRRPLALTGAGLALAFCTPALAQLTKAESKMAATVDAEYERSVALLEKLVNQNSGSMNFDGVRKVGDMMRGELERIVAHPGLSKNVYELAARALGESA